MKTDLLVKEGGCGGLDVNTLVTLARYCRYRSGSKPKVMMVWQTQKNYTKLILRTSIIPSKLASVPDPLGKKVKGLFKKAVTESRGVQQKANRSKGLRPFSHSL